MENKTILVVDDNIEFCENVKDIAELEGYRVLTAYDGFQALDAVRSKNPDIVLLDIKMPGMDGVTAFKKIKEVSPSVRVIMVTAFSVEEMVKETLREGAFGFMRKPLEFERLFEVIRYAVNGGLMLLVDDDRELCDNMRDILEQAGFNVRVAFDGEDAIKKATESAFDVMLLDMKLPTLNGLETYLAVRDIRPRALVIVITGCLPELEKLAGQVLDSGAYTLLEKPLDLVALIALLEGLIRPDSFEQPV